MISKRKMYDNCSIVKYDKNNGKKLSQVFCYIASKIDKNWSMLLYIST